MKRGVLLFSLLFLFYCMANADARSRTNTGNPVLVFANGDTLYDFGGIPQGEGVENQFEVKNSGNAPLIITGVKCDSGHVTCKWTSTPIKPGKTGTIIIAYIAEGNVGSFFDDIVITSNATKVPYPFLHIKGAIIPERDHYIIPPKKKQTHHHGPA